MAFYPEEFEKALEVINSKCIVQFKESSSFNDLCENATYTNEGACLVVYFPNLYGRSAENKEEITTFAVEFQHENGDVEYLENEAGSDEMTLEEVIVAVNNLAITNEDLGVDLFEHPEFIPADVKALLEDSDNLDYSVLSQLTKDVELLGYTFEYSLDALPFKLRKI